MAVNLAALRHDRAAAVLVALVAVVLATGPAPASRASGATPALAASAAAAPSLPPVPARWPFDRFELGLVDGPGGAAALHASAPFGLRYQYLAGGVNTGNGWQTWNEGGQFVDWYAEDSAAHGAVPVFSYYMIYQSNPGTGADEAAAVLSNLRNPATMNAYWADVEAFFRHANATTPVILHVEPDMWGYMEQAATADQAPTVAAAVGASGFADVAGLPDNAAGVARAFVHLRDLYAPNVILAYHLSGWGTMVDLHANAPADPETDALALRAAAFYASLGAQFDIVFTDIADRDAGFRAVVSGDGGASWWAAADFPRWVRFIAGFVAASGQRVAVWQIPVGNTTMRAMDDTWGHFRDNRVEWFIDDPANGHLAAWRDAGVVALLFGGGAEGTTCACDAMGDGVTNPAPRNGTSRVSLSADDDGGYLRDRAGAFYAGGGLSLEAGGGPPTPTPTPTPAPTASPTPTSAPVRWAVSATLSATTIHRRHSLRITTRVTASRSARALVDVEIYDSRGLKVAQRSWDAATFRVSRARSFAWTWWVGSARRPGVYTVKVGVFRPGWGALLAWRDRARTFVVVR